MRKLVLVCLLFTLSAWIAVPNALAQVVDEYSYFSTRLARISDQLQLTGDQQAKLKPMVEQETGLMEQIYGNPALSRKAKLKKYWAIIGKTNEKIKPMLTPEQLQAFETVQTTQKQKYNELMEQAKKGS